MTDRSEPLGIFNQNRWLAHTVLFRRRHPDESSEAHERLVRAIYNPTPRQLIEGFRGLGKSTYLEEAAIIKACFREFHNMVIVGASYTRACDRLMSIKREFEINDDLQKLFGQQKGAIWQEGKIVLANGVCIQALGRDQSTLGMKYLDWRPDCALVDDVEDPEEVRTDVDREQTWGWFLKTFLPSLAHPLTSWVRVLGTRRGTGSLPERIEKDGWPTVKIPIEYTDEDGERRATWPSKFPLEAVDAMQRTYRGDMHTFMQEFMCQPYAQTDRVFSREMFRVEPRERTWEATYAMIDPARTTNRKSAMTGYAVWSWVGPRLIVWTAGAENLLPDEIIELAFRIHDNYNPVWVGVEEDGLNEWIKQPLRTEMLKRHRMIPIKAVRAPRNKLSFISQLQVYFNAGEVVFAHAQPELEAQLLSFPTGKIDAPNALAYAIPMRPAAPIYDGFGQDHVAPSLNPVVSRPLYLAANATRSMVAAALVQFADRQLRVLADWVEEGAPDDIVSRIHAEACLLADTGRDVARKVDRKDWAELLKVPDRKSEFARFPLKWIVPPHHADRWNNVGLMQAVQRVPAGCSRGLALDTGRRHLAAAMAGNRTRNLAVSDTAQWTLRALSGGYSRGIAKGGGLTDEAEPGPYRLLMEGVESFCGMMADTEPKDDMDTEQNYTYDKRGRRYLSSMPAR